MYVRSHFNDNNRTHEGDYKMMSALPICFCIVSISAVVIMIVTMQLFVVESPVKHLVVRELVPPHSKSIVDDRFGRYIHFYKNSVRKH